MQVLLQRLAGQAERTQQLEGQAQQAEAVQLELQAGLEMAGARLCLVLAAWTCAVAGKHKVGSCSATCSALPAAIMWMAAKHNRWGATVVCAGGGLVHLTPEHQVPGGSQSPKPDANSLVA